MGEARERAVIRVEAYSCGWITMPLGFLLAGETGQVRIPVPAYAIHHPKGVFVFDTGLHPDLIEDPTGPLGPLTEFQQVDLAPGTDLASRLRGSGIDPDGVGLMANSHLHFDHCGGNVQLPNARMMIQRREWTAANDRAAEPDHYILRHFDHGHDRLLLDGEHDVFGDGTVMLMPTHGHTHGHQSLLVRRGGKELLLAADACYMCRSLEKVHPSHPRSAHDAEEATRSLQWIHDRWKRGTRVFPGHEPEFWRGANGESQHLD